MRCLLHLNLVFFLFHLSFDFLISNGDENLLERHIANRVRFNAKPFEIWIYLLENFFEVASKVVSKFVDTFTSLINVESDFLILMICLTVDAISFVFFNYLQHIVSLTRASIVVFGVQRV